MTIELTSAQWLQAIERERETATQDRFRLLMIHYKRALFLEFDQARWERDRVHWDGIERRKNAQSK